MQCSVRQLTFPFSLEICLVCTKRFPLNDVGHSIHHFMFVPVLLLSRVICLKMTSSVANNFFLLFGVVFFPTAVLKLANLFFLMRASTWISDPQAGPLESHVMVHSKRILFCHRTISFSWNYQSPETFSPLKTSSYSLCYQLYCWKLCIFQSQTVRILPVIFILNGEYYPTQYTICFSKGHSLWSLWGKNWIFIRICKED